MVQWKCSIQNKHYFTELDLHYHIPKLAPGGRKVESPLHSNKMYNAQQNKGANLSNS